MHLFFILKIYFLHNLETKIFTADSARHHVPACSVSMPMPAAVPITVLLLPSSSEDKYNPAQKRKVYLRQQRENLP